MLLPRQRQPLNVIHADVLRAQAGDEAAQLRALASVEAMVLKLAKRFAFVSREPLDDLAQAGRMGVLRAMQTWQPAGGARWSNWAWGWIRAYISAECQRCVPFFDPCRRAALGHPILRCPLDELTERDTATPSGEDALVWRMDVRAGLETLSPVERHVVGLRIAGDTVKEVGVELGVSGQRIHQISKQAARKLKKQTG
jgi:RNA polymerase sigma factor (sigma-70 family)